MYSNILNKENAQVEQLAGTGTLVQVTDLGGATTYTANVLRTELNVGRVYEIHSIKLAVTHFFAAAIPAFAFPKFEQFDLTIGIKVSIGAGNIAASRMLFDDMRYATSDGISNTWIFNEPFIFKSDNTENQTLFIQFTVNTTGTVFVALTGIAAGNNFAVNGTITFEGISWSLSQFEKLQQKIIGRTI